VIDTEGLGAFDEDENHDTKIFLLALLLCSLLVYNSLGSIDEGALTNLSLVVNLSKSLQANKDPTSSSDLNSEIDELALYFPSFMWVLRDFALQLVDQDGKKITQKEYLENSLREQKGTSESIVRKNKIRRLIQHFFKDRDCSTLVRPIEDERQLQKLADVPKNELREEFTTEIDELRKRIFTKAKIKKLRGKALNGSMLLQLAETYILALNQNEIPKIDNAWANVQNAEFERAFQHSLKECDRH